MTKQGLREKLLVELVDQNGSRIETTTVEDAHVYPGKLHVAFSVFLLTKDKKKLLMQKRAPGKLRWPLYWANSCCGHKDTNQSVLESAYKRLKEELGILSCELEIIGSVIYRADYSKMYSEYEYDYVLIGHLDEKTILDPDLEECVEVKFVSIDKSRENIPLVPWFNPCMNLVYSYINKEKNAF